MRNQTAEDQIYILDNGRTPWSIIREIATSGCQEDAFYVFDIGEIVRRHKNWKEKLPRVEPYYAVKCNDNLVALEVLAHLGTGFDCASKGEIHKILSLGVAPERIIYANPAKQSSHIKYASKVGVNRMTFDSEVELHKIKQLYPNAQLVIRIRCDAAEAQCQLGMKFGCDPVNDAPGLLKVAKELDLNVIGVSFHVGSGCKEPMVFRRAIKCCREIFDYAETIGYNFNLVDLGGGYPGGKTSSIDEIAEIINSSLSDYFPDESVEIIAEPGRYYVSSAFTVACNIYSMRNVHAVDKETGNEKVHNMYFINDGVYGSFNCILYDHQVVRPIPLPVREIGKQSVSASVWGPTCDGLDQVVQEMQLPEMHVGDWLVFEDMGAYTLAVASNFNGFPVPRVHVVVDEDIWMFLKGNIGPFTDKHFDMLSKPLLKVHFELDTTIQLTPQLPIRISMPLCSGETIIREHVLDYANVVPVE